MAIDTCITEPRSDTAIKFGSVRKDGAAAKAAAGEKRGRYHAAFEAGFLRPADLVAFALETSGHMSEDATQLLRELAVEYEEQQTGRPPRGAADGKLTLGPLAAKWLDTLRQILSAAVQRAQAQRILHIGDEAHRRAWAPRAHARLSAFEVDLATTVLA